MNKTSTEKTALKLDVEWRIEMVNRNHMKFLHYVEPFKVCREFTSRASNIKAEHFGEFHYF